MSILGATSKFCQTAKLVGCKLSFMNFEKSFTFPYVEKGSNYLIKEFPNEENYNDAKDKVQEL